MTKYYDVFQQQKEYNQRIRADSDPLNEMSIDDWTEIYLMGIVSEIDDVLDSIQWKRHRQLSNNDINRDNLGYDFADLTKYVLSLWELWGFSPQYVLHFVKNKSDILEELYRQEFESIPTDRLVVITDIDGTLGDWRTSFINWVSSTYGKEPLIKDSRTSLLLDSDLSMRYPDYNVLKESFENSGQYANIILYDEIHEFLLWLKSEFNAYIIAHTARPWRQHYRIWGDTWEWIRKNKLPIDKLQIGSESRILLATELGGVNVLMLEDDPGLMLRAAHSGIKVVARKHPYNNGVNHENIQFVGNFLDAKESIENGYQAYRQTNSTDS